MKTGGIIILAVVIFVGMGIGYGLWHDFTPEYEASVPIQYDMIVYDANGNLTTVGDLKHGRGNQNYIIQGDKVVALTPLNEEQMKIQEEQGCVACHPK